MVEQDLLFRSVRLDQLTLDRLADGQLTAQTVEKKRIPLPHHIVIGGIGKKQRQNAEVDQIGPVDRLRTFCHKNTEDTEKKRFVWPGRSRREKEADK